MRRDADALRAALALRAKLYATIRAFFAARDLLEVETPIVSAAANTDVNIASFSTRFDGRAAGERWLRTSPEFPLKRLLAAGVGDCYELGRVFRNGEAGRRHNPEFTMLEWYRLGFDHRRLIGDVAALVAESLALVGRRADVVEISYLDLYLGAFGFDPHLASLADMQAPLADVRIDARDLAREDWLDLLMTHRLQPTFPRDRLTFVYDYPASQCALARIRAGDPPVAERFEAFIGPHELANGYHELTDAREQRERFERDNARRVARGGAALPIDERLLSALENGLPACAGVALGIERLLMALLDTEAIADTLAFPFDEA